MHTSIVCIDISTNILFIHTYVPVYDFDCINVHTYHVYDLDCTLVFVQRERELELKNIILDALGGMSAQPLVEKQVMFVAAEDTIEIYFRDRAVIVLLRLL